jgi:pimeloyl-ACP methyl ester carboxylesterase
VSKSKIRQLPYPIAITMSHTQPTIVFLAGAFADPSCFDKVAAGFNNAGYPTAYAEVLSMNPSDPSTVSTSKDAEHVRATTLLPLLKKGKDVILFAHSYGGIVAAAAAAGLSKSARHADAKPGGIIGLLYLAGNIVAEGESLLDAIGGSYPPFIKENQVRLQPP